MTVPEALTAVRSVGTVQLAGGKLKLRFPESVRVQLQPAIATLRTGKAEALALMAPSPAELDRATGVLNRSGCRIMQLEGGLTIGIWSDLDGPEIRGALRVLEADQLPVQYLDSPRTPLRYKVRRAAGEPVPENVRREMELHPEAPWVVRARLMGKGRFVPWPAAPSERSHTRDPRTGIWPAPEWGSSCGRGFVSDSRFGPGQTVIKRTNRQAARNRRKKKR